MNEVHQSSFANPELTRRSSYNHQLENLTLDSGYTSSSLRRAHSLQRPSSHVTIRVQLENGDVEQIKNLSVERLAKNFEVFDANPTPTELQLPFTLVTRFAMVRQLLDDRLALNTADEIIDILQIARHWRVKKKMRKKILDRIDQMINMGGMCDDDMVRRLGNMLSKDEFNTIFQVQMKQTERDIGRMELALRTQQVVDEAFLSGWVSLLGHPLIQPRCETLFEIMKNVCLAMLEKPVKWDEIDLLKIFLKAHFISESGDIQRAIYNSLERFVDDNNNDSIGFSEYKLGLVPDHVQDQFRYIVMKMGWHVSGEHFAKILFESGMTSPIHITLSDGTTVCSDMISCALNAGHWEIGSYLLEKYHSSSCLTFKKLLSIDDNHKLGEHQQSARRAMAFYSPQFQISLEYFAEELKTKSGMDFILNYFSQRLRSADIACQSLSFNDIKSDIMTPLQKAVSLNKVELVKKYVNVFGADLNAVTPEFPLPPIFIAASKRKVRSTEFLVKSGATLNMTITVNMENISVFDVICANKATFQRTEDKVRRIMARQFYRKVIDDAKRASMIYPLDASPHYMKNFSTWPVLPVAKFRNNTSTKLKEFINSI